MIYHIWVWWPSWSCDLDYLYIHCFPLPIDAYIKFGFDWPSGFRGDRGRTDDGNGRTLDHPISSPCVPNGLGELIRPIKNICASGFPTLPKKIRRP